MKALLFAIAVMFTSACSYYSAGPQSSEMNKLSVGMSKQEVLSELGEPTRTEASEGVEQLIYLLTDKSTYASTVITAGLLPPARQRSEYVVILKNGRVESFGAKK